MTYVAARELGGLSSRLFEVARSLELYAAPAFLTDPGNRVVAVNQHFAALIGDPLRDGVALDDRFVPALIVEAYRERFPDGPRDVAACLLSFGDEVAKGRLAAPALQLAARLLEEPRIRRLSELGPWNGVLVSRTASGHFMPLREQVAPVAGFRGERTNYHVSVWLPADSPTNEGIAEALTPRQLQIARLYSRGLNSTQVAAHAGVARSTARDHLEQIYARLGVHSRAELAATLAREHLA